jgi:hypothetical protein
MSIAAPKQKMKKGGVRDEYVYNYKVRQLIEKNAERGEGGRPLLVPALMERHISRLS